MTIFGSKKLHAFAGIGEPSNFFKLLDENNLEIQKKIEFPDHYKFTKSDIKKMKDEALKNNCELITTEKDYFRIKDYGLEKINFVKIKLEIYEKEKFINQILSCK